MSNPYIQFELDAAKKAPILASALGIQLREAVGGLALMWLHVYGGRGDTVTSFFLRSFFGVAPDMVGEALVELGFAEQVDATTWRVRGAGRYTRLSEVRREAGRKGAAATNERRSDDSAIAAANGAGESAIAAAKPTNGSANVRQTPEEAGKRPANARQTVGKRSNESANARQTVGKIYGETGLPRQKAALDPRSEISSPIGEERSRRSEDLHRAREEATGSALEGPASASRGDEGDEEARPRARVPRVPPGHYMLPSGEVRPICTPGTPEWADAERRGDWAALGWTGQA